MILVTLKEYKKGGSETAKISQTNPPTSKRNDWNP